MNFPTIDIIIPVYNAEKTLMRAVKSVLNQPHFGQLWLIDDCSKDNSFTLMQQLASQYPHKIQIEQMPKNVGPAKARNWGALQSQSEFIAFLDADDAYEQDALEVASSVFAFRPEISVVRLALTPVDLAERYAKHPNFDYAWQHMRMTTATNTVFRRAFFLACGGFPQDDLFAQFGGEDGALGIATTKINTVATLFKEKGVLHYCREGMHAERLLNAILFQQADTNIQPEHYQQAEAITERICHEINQLKISLNTKTGIQPLILERK
ncbi:glycosyltransferase family 2 protein [Conservatibacter flavescens]|uniref:Glycosyltransferase n=1 Tax=Conservatibacter flavescens TaxID=28161 RepID=A0A2M8S4P0_9PAST|nr:glycosyltransferase family A protein [Conservatibacter flavescens]PJG86048.1 glycosyltransferase [Conservatibacter flavescens]